MKNDDSPSSFPRLPTLAKSADISLIVLAILAVLAAAFVARPVLFPIVLGTLMALALRPLARFLSRVFRIPSVAVAGSMVILLILTTFAGIYLLAEPAAKWAGSAPRHFEQIERKIRPVTDAVEGVSDAAEEVEEMTEEIEEDDEMKVELARPTLTSIVLSATSEVLLEIGIAIACLFILLAFGDTFLERMAKAAESRDRRRQIMATFKSAEKIVSQYLFTFTLINIGLGTVIGLGLWTIGLPNPILWGVMAGALNFIPYIGLAVGSAIVYFIALVTFDSAWYATLAPAIYLTANLIEANAVTPALLGRAMSVNVVVLFIGVLFWGWLWGIGGALIAIPLIATIRTICYQSETLKPVARLLGQRTEAEKAPPDTEKTEFLPGVVD